MTRNRPRINRSQTIKRIKAMAVTRKNLTFNLPVDLIDKFRGAVEKDGVKMTDVITLWIKDYLGEAEN